MLRCFGHRSVEIFESFLFVLKNLIPVIMSAAILCSAISWKRYGWDASGVRRVYNYNKLHTGTVFWGLLVLEDHCIKFVSQKAKPSAYTVRPKANSHWSIPPAHRWSTLPHSQSYTSPQHLTCRHIRAELHHLIDVLLFSNSFSLQIRA